MALRSFAPFRQRAFTLVFLGALVSNIGTWMEATALSYFVADRGSVSASGLVAAAGFLPGAVLGPVGGAWADRFDRRRIMVIANGCSGLVAAAVAIVVATDHATPGRLALFSLVGGCTGAIGFPAFQAVLPDLVPKEDMVAAIGLSSTQWSLGRIVGPSLALLAIAVGGVPAALWINAVSFLAVMIAVVLARIPRQAVTARRSVLGSVRDGISFARTSAPVRAMVPIMALTVFVAAPFIGFIAQMATNVFDADQGGTSLLVTAQGVGAVVAGTALGSVSARFGVRTFLVGSIVVLAPALVAYGLAPNLWLAALAVLVTGGGYMAVLSACTSITQRSASSAERGRAMVVNNFLLGAAYPLGLLVQGVIADRWSLRTATAGSGVVLGGIALVLLLWPRRFTGPIAVIDTEPEAATAAAGAAPTTVEPAP